MNDFDNAMRKIADVLYGAARKSGEILDNTKKSYNISAEKDKIQKIQSQIGLKVYKASLADGAVPEYVQPEIDAIRLIEEKIAELERSIAETKSCKICLECGARIPQDDAYCAKCGAKQPAAASRDACCEDCADGGFGGGGEPEEPNADADCDDGQGGQGAQGGQPADAAKDDDTF